MMKKFTILRTAMMLFASVLFSLQGFAQVTTGSIKGLVSDSKNEHLPGATVVAVHASSGVKYGTITREDGRYNLNNVNSGIYNLTISFIGYKEAKYQISVSIGDETKANAVLVEEGSTLSEVVVKADKNFNKDKLGAEQNISSEQVQALPTVSRSLSDFTRLTPQIKVDNNGAVSVAGQNNRYNSIYIDGAANNDVFGLSASGTNGGQSGISPISVDAIEQFKVVVSPYDVSLSGFTGGGINAVTRSGSNNLSGSAYYFFRNENLVGKKPGTNAQYDDPTFVRSKLADFNSYTTGFRIGGPIIKDKLFFFFNGEVQREISPIPFTLSSYQGALKQADLDNLSSILKSKYNYDAGSYTDIVRETNSNKLTGKIDWNINEKHKLSVSHRYTYGESISPSVSTNQQISFSNGGIYFPSTTNSSSFELKSNLKNNLTNKILIGYTRVEDDRDPIGGNFPSVFINQTTTKDRIQFGSEAFSSANQLSSKILTFNQKLDFYTGKHSISAGLDGEFGNYYNLFVRQNFGAYTFASLQDFLDGKNPTNYDRSYSLLPNDISGDGSKAAAEFKSARFGVFLNDKFDITDKLTLTAGVRVDLNSFPTKASGNIEKNDAYLNTINAIYPLDGAKAGIMPSNKISVSPRLGFNYDVKGDRTLQVRGGTGIFLGRVPMVWPGGVYTNSGVLVGGVSRAGVTNTKPFVSDVAGGQYTLASFGGSDVVPSGELNLITNTFKLPSVWRSSLGIDKRVGNGWIFSVEGIYTKNRNDVAYSNVVLDKNAIKQTAGADIRTIYSPTASSPAKIDLDATTAGVQNPYTRIFLMKNADKKDNGYSYNVSFKVEKSLNNLTTSLAYTYGKSMVLNEATSSQNSSQWRYMETVSGRNAMKLSRSDFDLGHRIVGFASYKVDYLKFGATTLSLFYNGQSSNPFSYVYRNSIVNDWARTESNDLIFIPATKDQIVFKDNATADAQWAALDEYIKSDSYLNNNRGGYAERNSSRPPMVHIFDFKILQDFYINAGGKKHTLQLSWDVFNIGNLVNKKWGRQYFVNNDNFPLVTFEGFKNAAGGDYTPLMSFKKPTGTPWGLNDGSTGNISRWSSQLGIRYIFN